MESIVEVYHKNDQCSVDIIKGFPCAYDQLIIMKQAEDHITEVLVDSYLVDLKFPSS